MKLFGLGMVWITVGAIRTFNHNKYGMAQYFLVYFMENRE